MSDAESNRRPIQARSVFWAQRAASYLAATNISPNQISVASIFFALAGAIFLLSGPSLVGLLGTAIAIQARLLCNLLDGMVAVEGGKKSLLGQIYKYTTNSPIEFRTPCSSSPQGMRLGCQRLAGSERLLLL